MATPPMSCHAATRLRAAIYFDDTPDATATPYFSIIDYADFLHIFIFFAAMHACDGDATLRYATMAPPRDAAMPCRCCRRYAAILLLMLLLIYAVFFRRLRCHYAAFRCYVFRHAAAITISRMPPC